MTEPKGFKYVEGCTCVYCKAKRTRSLLAPKVPLAGLVDEFGFPLPAGTTHKTITMEDAELIRRFLGQVKDNTLSRGVYKVLEDLLGRLK